MSLLKWADRPFRPPTLPSGALNPKDQLTHAADPGARSAILAAKNKVDNTQGWLTNLLKRRHPNIAAVALANKNVRTVWALLAHGREFQADYMPTRVPA